MKPVDSTYKILAYKILGRGVDEEWVQWAQEMIVAGYDTEYLIILAGEMPFFNQFEMKVLTDKVFKELGLSYENPVNVIRDYIYSLVNQVLDGKMNDQSALEILYGIYWQVGHISNESEKLLDDFYSLSSLKEDVIYSSSNRWPEATIENAGDVIKNYFIEWKKNYENANT